MDTQEAYDTLGLAPDASDAQLKAAWRRLVAAWHPDRNAAPDASGRMQGINKAYQHLRQQRQLSPEEAGGSDSDAAAEQRPAPTAPAPPPTAEQGQTGAADSTHVRRVRLTLEDAVRGCTRNVRGHFNQTCDSCAGQGQRVLAQACSTCRGSGAVRTAALFGWLWSPTACPDCGGDGRQRAGCDGCDGSGERAVAYRRQVRFPAGVRDGQLLSLPSARHGKLKIRLELQVEIEPHPLFVLDEDSVLRCDMPVNGYAWMAGRWVEVPTPDGLQQMRLNREALVYRLRGQGFPAVPHGPRGDYLVRVTPVFPTQVDPAQEALLDQLIAQASLAAAADGTSPLGPWQQRLSAWTAGQQADAPDA
jgi:molecular chaperone DnaJ